MTHLVADDGADGAIVHGVVGIRIKKGRLQDARGKLNLVQGRAVRRVHRRRHHAPLRAVDGLAEPSPPALPAPIAGTGDVFEIGSRPNEEGRIIAPRVGVGDLPKKRVEFDGRLLFRGSTHPIELADPFP